MRISSISASRLDLQKDGTYKYAYKKREVIPASSNQQQSEPKAGKRKPAKRKPRAA